MSIYSQIAGIPGMSSQLETAQRFYDRPGNSWSIYRLMGRKFESERAIFFAGRGALVSANATSSEFDLNTRNFGTIQYIQVKWSNGPMPISTRNDVVVGAKMHPSGSYLVESNNIDRDVEYWLMQQGGKLLPFSYP